MRSPRTAPKSGPHSLQLEKAMHSNEEPKAAKNKFIFLKNDGKFSTTASIYR